MCGRKKMQPALPLGIRDRDLLERQALPGALKCSVSSQGFGLHRWLHLLGHSKGSTANVCISLCIVHI